MKKINYLISILFVVGLMTVGCEKEDIDGENQKVSSESIVSNEPIVLSDLVGDWDFVSLEWNDTVFTGCDPNLLSEDRVYPTLSLYNLSEENMTVDVHDECDGNGPGALPSH